uniref:LIM zinc-binding domain-containing protein n=1 Tax=Sinocyclocheilus rhinocerous TaxID=307959 RepID=A0A673J7U7_9TELE
MISEGSCDTEDWSNDAENSAFLIKFHPEHFVCAFCLKQLNKGTFKEQNEKPYCQGCFIKLFIQTADKNITIIHK